MLSYPKAGTSISIVIKVHDLILFRTRANYFIYIRVFSRVVRDKLHACQRGEKLIAMNIFELVNLIKNEEF